MAYTVFISHSTRNREPVITLANLLTKLDVNVFVAEWYLTPGESLAQKMLYGSVKSTLSGCDYSPHGCGDYRSN